MTAAGRLWWRTAGRSVLATGDLLAGGGEHVPAGAERFGAVAVGGAGAGVAGEGVQRVPGVGELMRPAGRVVSPAGERAAPPVTVRRVLLAVTGGQAAAHARVQAEVVPWSASKAYTVKPRPVVKIVPTAVCRSASAAPPAALARAAGALDGAAPSGPVPPAEELRAATTTAEAVTASGIGKRLPARSQPKGLVIVPARCFVIHLGGIPRDGQTGWAEMIAWPGS